MSIAPTSPALFSWVEHAFRSALASVTGLFGRHDDLGFSPDQVLGTTPGIDPHFIPRVAMSNANIDIGLLTKLSNEGYKRGKEVTAQTHPALHRVWVHMCARAGIGRVPQLIFADSKTPNAASLFDENAVVVSTGLLKKLDLRELSAVLGHELGHESSDHTTPRALALGLLGGAGVVLGDRIAHHGGIGSYINYEKMNEGFPKQATRFLFGAEKKPLSWLDSIIYMVIGGSLGGIFARQISVHPTELEADRKGARISGDPEGLISALNKLEDLRAQKHGVWPAIKRGVRFITSGYPSTDTRVAKLQHIAQTMPPGITPAYQVVEQPVAAAATAAIQPPHALQPGAQVTHISAQARVEQAAQAPAAAV